MKNEKEEGNNKFKNKKSPTSHPNKHNH